MGAAAAVAPSARPRTAPAYPHAVAACRARSVQRRGHHIRPPEGAWEGARASGDGPPASAAPVRPRWPQRSPRRGAAVPVRGHPLGRDGGPGYRGARRPNAPRGSRPLGENAPVAPRPGASVRPSSRWASKRVAQWRTPVRWTPTAWATRVCEGLAANRSTICPRGASPAARVVDRCHRSKVWCTSGERTRGQDDLRPRAIASSSQLRGKGWGRDTSTRSHRHAHLHGCS